MGSHEMVGPSKRKKIMTKWCEFRLFSALFITKCSYTDIQSHQPVLWWFPADYLPGQVSWSHLQTTWAPVDARQVHEWCLSKSKPLNLWQWDLKLCMYKTPLADLVTNRGLQRISLVHILFLKDSVEAPNNNNVCIMQVLIYIHLLAIIRWHDKAASFNSKNTR